MFYRLVVHTPKNIQARTQNRHAQKSIRKKILSSHTLTTPRSPPCTTRWFYFFQNCQLRPFHTSFPVEWGQVSSCLPNLIHNIVVTSSRQFLRLSSICFVTLLSYLVQSSHPPHFRSVPSLWRLSFWCWSQKKEREKTGHCHGGHLLLSLLSPLSRRDLKPSRKF